MQGSVFNNHRCLSCDTRDEFCSENTDHLCRACFKEVYERTQRRVQQHKLHDEAREAVLKSQTELQAALEEVKTKLEELTRVNRQLVEKVESLEKRLLETTANLDAVVSSNAVLVEKMAALG